ncbi:MAG: DUF1850 domain-containing protein [Desulfobacteraceae bacterium]|nr:MAG: DUF1850 domain-containing protein [Desulfobacteraceae bacterium]
MSRRYAASALIAIILGAGILFLPFITALEISDFKTRQRLLLVGMESGEEFTISFIHSVNRRPVYDTLRVESDHLVIVRSRYDSFGAGMPESSTGEGTFKVAKDGWLEWTVNRPVPDITVRVGWTAEHTLHVKDRKIRLSELAEPGSALTIRVINTGIIDFLKGRSIK